MMIPFEMSLKAESITDPEAVTKKDIGTRESDRRVTAEAQNAQKKSYFSLKTPNTLRALAPRRHNQTNP
jgi:hypothetical protein